MSDTIDFRVSCDLFDHPKWMRLEDCVGEKAGLALLRLWSWARRHRKDGDLTGLSDGEIASAARWKGRSATLIEGLVETGWIDGTPGKRALHDWADWQGWSCGSPTRTFAARVAAMTRQCLKLGMTPDAYIDSQGGSVATDSALRDALRATYYKPKRPRRGTRDVPDKVRAECGPHRGPDSGPDAVRCAPCPSPSPSPNGGGEAAPRPTAPAGSVAAPPVDDSRPPLPPRCAQCRDTRRIVRPRRASTGTIRIEAFSSLLVPCPDCAGGEAAPAEPAAAAPEAPERGYAVSEHVLHCAPPRPSWRVVGPPRTPRRRWLQDQDEE